jgi:hypothetical protein
MPPNTVPRVMISSTFIDLKEHREAAIDALLAAGFYPVVMEHNIGTPDDHVISSSLDMVDSAAAYICLIGDRYGQTPTSAAHNADGLSVTELEFNRARGKPLPIRLLIMGDNHPIARVHAERDPDKLRKLEAFRASAKTLEATGDLHRIYQTFDSLDEFKVAIASAAHSLRDHLTRPIRARRRRVTTAAPQSPFRITDSLEVDGLVELKLHPTLGNNDETFRLDATISFGILPYDYDGTTVEIALTEAEIAITSRAYQPVHRSRVCDRTDHVWLKPAPGGGISVVGPQRRGALYGDPLGPDHLAVMERLDDAEGPVTVEIRARSTASIRTEAQDAAVTVNKQAIIDAILSEGERKDLLGRLVFARRRVSRRIQP